MPLLKQLLFQPQKPLPHLRTDASAFRDGGEITLDVSPANLTTLQGQPAVGAMRSVTTIPSKASPPPKKTCLATAAERLRAR